MKQTSNELQKSLKRSAKSINFKAYEMGLKKDYETYCKTRKHTNININSELIENLYNSQKKSIRKIASELSLSKNTVLYYLDKYKIRRRTISEANKNFYYSGGKTWKKGLSKETDKRILLASEKMKTTYAKIKLQKLREKEREIGMPLKEAIYNLYWSEKLTQKKVAEKLKISRLRVINLMKELDIDKRPKFQYISSLKGKDHPMYGKTWEEFYGIEEAKKFKEKRSIASRKNIILRLQNREMPFLNTKIEKLFAQELNKRNISFIVQYNIDNKFACDLAIPKYKIIIECDGDYWHGNPSIYDESELNITQRKNIQRDKFKDIYLKNKGWLVLRFFESDILNSVSSCVNQVEKLIPRKSIIS